jgi:hypothetical protein
LKEKCTYLATLFDWKIKLEKYVCEALPISTYKFARKTKHPKWKKDTNQKLIK